jgi:UDP-N-acetyl-D-mannosaminuronate dehydrogenase
MPAYVVSRLQDVLNTDGVPINGAKILMLGVAYKADISDTRESPAYDVAALLAAKGAELAYHDPFVAEFLVDGQTIPRVDDPMSSAGEYDAVILIQRHSGFDVSELAERSKKFFDTRGVANRDRAHLL